MNETQNAPETRTERNHSRAEAEQFAASLADALGLPSSHASGDTSNDPNAGLYHKYNVARVDGRDAEGGDKHGAEYFVLDLTNDPFAIVAVVCYAEAIKAIRPKLAADIHDKAKAMLEKMPTEKQVQLAGALFIAGLAG